MIQNTLLSISGVAQIATGITVTKFVAEYRSTEKEKAGKILGLCSLLTLITGLISTVVLIVAGQFVSNYLRAPQLTVLFMIGSFFIFFSVVNGYQVGALAGLESYNSIAKGGMVYSLFYVIAGIMFATKWGLEGAVIGLVITSSLRWYVYYLILRSEGKRQNIFIQYKNVWAERLIISKFALPAAISGISTLPVLWLANSFLVRQENGFSQMGLYSAANNLRVLTLFLPLMLNNVGTSLLNNKKGLGDGEQFKNLFWINFIMTAIFISSGIVVVSVAGDRILSLFGKDFIEGRSILLILLLSTIPEGLAVAAYQVIQSSARMWLSLFAVTIPRDLSFILFAYYLIPKYGGRGLAVAYSLAWVIACSIIIIIVAFFADNRSYVS